MQYEEIQQGFKEIQDHICNFFLEMTGENFLEDLWDYDKGSGGGRTRIWEGRGEKDTEILEKAGVNYSGIIGDSLPDSALQALKISDQTPFCATGVSLVIHPQNPHIPTIHMNIRYFEAGEKWWFGGGIDLTPYYPKLDDCINFHKHLKQTCDAVNTEFYPKFKQECDKYFMIPHRNEARGIGGIFFDHLTTGDIYKENKEELWNFVKSVGMNFTELYRPLITKEKQSLEYTENQRDFQLMRRSRYVEFNLLYDRGTKFGLQSEGRTESILMSLPSTAKWKYNWKPEKNSDEEKVVNFYLKAQDWINL